ncbi:hypothetical protein F4779DRAFT_200571 [Xylariaceae sp. FL0662B]|nr:hypothetical protein F4779DRAFT_200571 [Xylariaceae sp. FL0662B]
MEKIANFPSTVKQWKKLEQEHRLCGQSIYDRNYTDSGSVMGIKQYILLRSVTRLYDAKNLLQKERNPLISKDNMNRAENILKGRDSFTHYCESFTRQPSQLMQEPFAEYGSFSMVRKSQILTQGIKAKSSTPKVILSPKTEESKGKSSSRAPETPSTPTRQRTKASQYPGMVGIDVLDEALRGESPTQTHDPSTPDITGLSLSPHSPATNATPGEVADDEQLVNVAAVQFLQALTMHHQCTFEWSYLRKAFKLQIQTGEGLAKVFEARVDGCLRMSADPTKVRSIIEVKPVLRYPNDNVIQIKYQETAQLAAFIANQPPENLQPGEKARYLLISQDKHEMYFSIATFGLPYLHYIQGRTVLPGDDSLGWLDITEYGPFDTAKLQHMKVACHFMLAYTLQQCENEASKTAEKGSI